MRNSDRCPRLVDTLCNTVLIVIFLYRRNRLDKSRVLKNENDRRVPKAENEHRVHKACVKYPM